MILFQKYIAKIKTIFSQGLSLKEIVLAGILGALTGIMPVFGISTLLGSFLAIRLKLNIGVTLFFTYAVSPIHPLLFIPFIHIGEYLLGVKHTLLTFVAIKTAFRLDYVAALQKLWLEFICGISGWSIISLPILFSVFYLSFKRKTNEV